MTDLAVKISELSYPHILFEQIEPSLDTTALIQRLVKPESLINTFGESGSGKTFDSTHRSLCIASGRPYFDRQVEPGLTVYLAAEGGIVTQNRIYAYRRELFPNAAFVLVPYSMDLLTPDGDVQGVIDLVKRLEDQTGEGCALITQDTLARAMPGGNENSPEDMGLLVANADRIRHAIGCAFEFIHHAGKDTSKGARGHSCLRAATDTELEVSASNGLHIVRITKQRDLPLGDEFCFRLRQIEIGRDRYGEPITTCIPEPAERTDPDTCGGPTQQERLAIQALEEAFRQHQIMPPREVISEPSNRINPGRNVCPVSKWRQIYLARKIEDRTKPDSAERAFRRYAESLQTKGIIKVYRDWVWFLKG